MLFQASCRWPWFTRRHQVHANTRPLQWMRSTLPRSAWIWPSPGVPNGLLPNGLNDEQLDCLDQLRDAARAALSDSKTDSSNAVDGGRQLARSRLMLILELCERMLAAKENREVVWFSRNSTFDPQQGYSQPDETAPALLNIAPLSVAGRLREGLFAGHTVVLTSATLAIGSAFEPAAGASASSATAPPRAGPGSMWVRPLIIPNRVSCMWPSTSQNPVVVLPPRRSTNWKTSFARPAGGSPVPVLLTACGRRSSRCHAAPIGRGYPLPRRIHYGGPRKAIRG